jgi:hypothetical protein
LLALTKVLDTIILILIYILFIKKHVSTTYAPPQIFRPSNIQL